MADRKDKAAIGVREAAADWTVRLNTGGMGAAEQGAFMEWLRKSPVHVKEYLRAEASWGAMDGPAKEDRSDVAALLRDLPGNLIDLRAGVVGVVPRTESTPAVQQRSRSAIAAALAVVTLAAATAGALWWSGGRGGDSYSTAVGELRRVVLADGSAMEINTATKVRVSLSDTGRDIHLDEGEAFFEVASDPHRPFRVIAGDVVVRAVGTQFNVYRQPEQTRVTVTQGRVAVTPPHSKQPVELSADRTAIVELRADTVEVRESPEISRAAVSWRQRRLIFRNETLAGVVAQFNRYNRRQLTIDDAQLAAERISAVFDANDPGALVRFLAQQSQVQSRELADDRILLAPAGD